MALTPLEAECLEMWLQVQERLSRHKIGQWEYMELMGLIRDIIRKLENKSFGCVTGLHVSHCTCTDGHEGRSIYGLKWEKRQR